MGHKYIKTPSTKLVIKEIDNKNFLNVTSIRLANIKNSNGFRSYYECAIMETPIHHQSSYKLEQQI